MFPGSSTKSGYYYHEPPVPGDFKFQRADNTCRLEPLLLHQEWKNKTVLDYGCNVGYFSTKLAMQGAKVIGIDIDTEAIEAADRFALEAKVGDRVRFIARKTSDRFLMSGVPEVAVVLSTVPWIIKTEPNPVSVLHEIFRAPTAYIELMYEGDGRAGMKGIKNDADARKWINQFYPIVHPIGWTKASNSGQKRTLWRATQNETAVLKSEHDSLGSQSFVFATEHYVVKKPRPLRGYQPEREFYALKHVEGCGIAPLAISANKDQLIMTKLQGNPMIAESTYDLKADHEWLRAEFDRIIKGLEFAGIFHNDVRPENLWMGADNHVYLLDFGWSTLGKPQKGDVPETINPEFKGKSDKECFDLIFDIICQ